MKYTFIHAALLLGTLSLLTNQSFAQQGWFWQNPLPQGNPLYGISFTDANTGTAVGGDIDSLREDIRKQGS